MRTRDSILADALEPLVAGLWIFFLIDSLIMAAVWGLGIGDATVEQWISNRDLINTFDWLLSYGDLIWIILGAAHVYLCFAAQDGLATARGWGIVIITTVVAVAWASVHTGHPLGPIEYSKRLGMKLGPVPVGLPLLWLAIILAAREAVLAYRPRWSQCKIAFGVGALAALTDLNLEPMAAKLRGLWFWRGSSPSQPPVFEWPLWSPLVWGLVALLLGLILRECDALAAVRQRRGKSAAPFLIFNAVFLLAHLGFWVRTDGAGKKESNKNRFRVLFPAVYEIGTIPNHQASLLSRAGTPSGRAWDGTALDQTASGHGFPRTAQQPGRS